MKYFFKLKIKSMLTEILIKPFIEDLERQGIQDTTPYEQGFMAGMAALSSILSEHVDNKAQLFVYLGMAISEGMQWIESQVSESPEKSKPIEFVAPRYHSGSEIDNLTPRKRQSTPSNAGEEIKDLDDLQNGHFDYTR